MKESIFIANIIPLTRLKNSLDFFSYKIESTKHKEFKIGSVVKINFRNKEILGIVIDIYEKNESSIPHKLKYISEIIPAPIFVNEWQVDLIKMVCSEYLLSYSHIAKLMLPSLKKITISNSVDAMNYFENTKYIKNTKKVKLDSRNVVKYRFNETLINYINNCIKNINDNEQIAIIFPRIKILYNILPDLISEQKGIDVVLPAMSKNKYFEIWKKIKTGNSKVIVGTRSSIFLPYNNLKHILIIDEEDENHSQVEQSPRYKVHFVANKIAKLVGAQLTLITRSPSIESLHNIAKKDFTYFEIDDKLNLPHIKILDPSKEKVHDNLPISITLDDEIQNCLNGKRKVLLYLNKKGYYTSYYCFSCLLTFNLNVHDNYCPKCKGVNYKPVGIGVHQLNIDLKKRYQNAKIFSIDSDNVLSDEEVMKNIYNADIVIGTDFVKDYVNFSEIGVVGVVNYDIASNQDQYDVNEKQFINLYNLTSRLRNNQSIIIQTKDTQNQNLISIYNYNLKTFYTNEISERELFHNPPIYNHIKLILKNTNILEVRDVYKKIISMYANVCEISVPILKNEKYEINLSYKNTTNLQFDKLKDFDVNIYKD